MKQRTLFRNNHTDSKIKIIGRINLLLVFVMFGIVIRDSFIHDLPFYYILYGIVGLIIGHVVSISQKVVLAEGKTKLSIKVHPIGKVLTILLLFFRFFAGQVILEKFNVIWATDALYLVFIGIYFSKAKNISNQIDELVFKYFSDNRE